MEILAAILGTILGGCIAAATQEVASLRQQARGDAASRLSVIIKLIQIQADFIAVRNAIRDAEAGSRGKGLSVVQALPPQANRLDRVDIGPAEIASVFSTDDADLANSLLLCASRHRMMIDFVETYSAIRNEMANVGTHFAKIDGISNVVFDEDEYRIYKKLHLQAKNILDHKKSLCEEQIGELSWMIGCLNIAMRQLDRCQYNFALKVEN